MTVIDVMAVGPDLIDSEKAKFSMEFIERYSQIAKLELICSETDKEAIIRLIRENARTGNPGDGLIAISPVNQVIKIRTGVSDNWALVSDPGHNKEA